MAKVEDERFPVETWMVQTFVSRQFGGHERQRAHLKVSVVVPVLNHAKYIERTLLSILNQSHSLIELIVIDGGSTDGTLDVLERYREHISYYHSGVDSGQSEALNHGFSQATGDVYAWMNSDDLYLPYAVNQAVALLETSPDASVVFGDWWSIDVDDRVIAKNLAFDFNVRHHLYEGFHLNSQAMFWRQEAHSRFGKFNVKLHRTMDYDLILRLGMNESQNRFVRLEVPLACFRRHEEQKTQGRKYDEEVEKEHRHIAVTNGHASKYTRIGRIFRLYYRLRRLWWYIRRDGIDSTYSRLAGKVAK